MGARLTHEFFQRDPLLCARELIGGTIGFGKCTGLIVETEAYKAVGDPACHTWKRPSARDFVARHQPGTAYVYLNYGMHWLFNLLVKGGTGDGFVLIRAMKPLAGIAVMQKRRNHMKIENLCNGPGKLTQAFGITGEHHGLDILSDSSWQLEKGAKKDPLILSATRIGISHASDYPWRFLLEGSRCVSVPA